MSISLFQKMLLTQLMHEKFLVLWVWIYFNLQGKSYSKDMLSENYFSNLLSCSIAVMVCDLTIQTVHVQQPAACHNSWGHKGLQKKQDFKRCLFQNIFSTFQLDLFTSWQKIMYFMQKSHQQTHKKEFFPSDLQHTALYTSIWSEVEKQALWSLNSHLP